MRYQWMSGSCRSAVLVAALSSNLAAQTSATPHDALLDLYFAESPEAAESHLLKSTRDQLRQVDPDLREHFLQFLMIARSLEKDEGVVSKRVNQGHTILQLQGKNPSDSMNVTLEKEQINVAEATLEAVLHRSGAESIPLTIRMRKEEGLWRLARVELTGEPDFFLSQLDSPHFVETLKRLGASRMAANEASAVGCLRTINTAEVTYSSTYAKGFSPDLKSLGGGESNPTDSGAGLIDDPLASGKKSGYTYSYAAGPKGTGGVVETYTVVARPDTHGKTGTRSYFTDQSGVIRYTKEDRAATADDPPLQ